MLSLTRIAILLLEPMLATGGSACEAIQRLLAQGVSEERIVFVNFVASKLGIEKVKERFPGLKLVTAAVDPEIDGHG
jgi:uracil phosphoribosyltransferase